MSGVYGITAVPSFVILASDGELMHKPDLFKSRKGVSSLPEQVFAAIDETERYTGGLSLKLQIGIGLLLGGVAFAFFRK